MRITQPSEVSKTELEFSFCLWFPEVDSYEKHMIPRDDLDWASKLDEVFAAPLELLRILIVISYRGY